MPIDVTMKVDLDSIIDDISDLAKKQVPYAGYLALNQMVYENQRFLRKILPYFIEGGPVAFTKRAVLYKRAPNKHNLRAEVYISDEHWKYMRWIIQGGQKRWAKSKAGIGKPIYKNVKFNKFGNIPGRKRKESAWRANIGKPKGQKQEGLGKNEFVATIRGTTALWKRGRSRNDLKMLILFDHKPVGYKQTFPFRKNAVSFGQKFMGKAFNDHLTHIVTRESKTLRAR